jgi:hypothetical protein
MAAQELSRAEDTSTHNRINHHHRHLRSSAKLTRDMIILPDASSELRFDA